MKHEEVYNVMRAICGSLLMVSMFMMPSCEDNRVEETQQPMMQLWVNGDPIDPFTYYGQINTYGEISVGEDGKIKKLLVIHFQREVGRVLPELEHYAAIWVDKDGEDNNNLIDAGLYLTLRACENISLRIADSLEYELTNEALVNRRKYQKEQQVKDRLYDAFKKDSKEAVNEAAGVSNLLPKVSDKSVILLP